MSTTGKPAEYGEPMPGSAADPSQKPLAAYRILAKNAGILVSPLQLGAMSLGGSWGGMLGKNDKAKSFEYLGESIELVVISFSFFRRAQAAAFYVRRFLANANLLFCLRFPFADAFVAAGGNFIDTASNYQSELNG